MTAVQIKSRLGAWRSWEMNPIVVKELRQAVRNWSVTGMLILFLLALLFTTVFVLLGRSLNMSDNMDVGGDVFTAFMLILSAASVLFIPLYMGIRMGSERQENNADLFYISTLSPARIVWGKTICGAYIAVLFFSACMPFMALTNLFRGVDLPTVFFNLGFLFIAICATTQLAIFLACLPVSRAFKFLFGLGQFILSFWIIGGVMIFSEEMMRSGVGSMMSDHRFWETTATTVGLIAAAGGLLFVLSVTLISPPSANRALLARIYVTLIWLGGGLLATDWTWREGQPWAIFIWTTVSMFLLIAALVVSVSNNDQQSYRVRRSIPKSSIRRLPAFLFYNGAVGGLVWVTLLVILTFFGAEACFGICRGVTASDREDLSYFVQTYPPLMVYAFAYALTGVFIHRTFFPKRPAKLAGGLALIVAAVLSLGPIIVLFFMNQLSWRELEKLQLGNAMNLFNGITPEQRQVHLYFACGWLGVMLLLNIKWFVVQIKNFRPAENPQALVPAAV